MSNATATVAQAPASTAAGAPQSNLPSGHASLYVGDLDDEVTEAMVYEKFSPIGQILSIRVCRDMISRKSLGYAYVNFATAAEAEKAIDQLNFDFLRNRQMRIMWSQRDPSLRKSGVGNLFIKNLDKSIQVRDLYDTFSTFGNILSCKIVTDEKGVSKGFGFLHFTSKDAADSAIKRLNAMLLKERKIFVGPFLPRSQRSNQGAGDANYNNVYVKNFGEDMDDERLKKMFGEYGEISSHIVMKNDEGVSRGFGFVCFKDPKDANAAVSALNGSDVNGRTLFVGRAMKKSERLEYLRNQLERKKADKSSRYAVGVNLYVKNLDDNMDEEALRKEFSQHGNITSVKVMRDISGRSKGFGFVCFSYPDEATKAVTEMSGKLVGGKPLYVALAQRKEERRLHLQGQYAQRQYMRGTVPPFHSAAIAPNALPPQPFPQTAGHPGLNMYFPGAAAAYASNPNSAMAAAQNYFGFPRNFISPNMAMQSRPQRWATPGAPGGPQGNPGMRPLGGIPSMPPNLIRPNNVQSNVPSQQPRFAQAVPTNVPLNTVNQMRPVVQAPQQRVVAGAMPGPMNAPTSVTGARPGQVQYSMAARNIQHPINAAGQVPRPAVDTSATGPSGDTVNAIQNLPMEEFMQIVQNGSTVDQKQALGEKLYSIVREWHPKEAGKLTGMLLEIDNRDLMSLILEHYKAPNSEATSLRQKYESALAVLTKSQAAAENAKREPDGSKVNE